ncbi:MAG: hypothetical protein IPG04_20650 [Polyangiaceae bacterium]|nr:hypothetical protein [Polyangiaceae bacterium]
MEPSILPALRRDSFVANVLWVGVSLLCQGPLGSGLDFRANARRGKAYCENGQGDELLVLWDEHGVVALVHDDDELPAPLTPPPPSVLQGLMERALSGSVKATGWLWICGDSSSPRLPPKRQDELLGLIDAFCGPPLIINDSPKKELFEAIMAGQTELTDALACSLLDLPRLSRAVNRGKTRLEAARSLAEDLRRFGLLWPNVEQDLAARWGVEL